MRYGQLFAIWLLVLASGLPALAQEGTVIRVSDTTVEVRLGRGADVHPRDVFAIRHGGRVVEAMVVSVGTSVVLVPRGRVAVGDAASFLRRPSRPPSDTQGWTPVEGPGFRAVFPLTPREVTSQLNTMAGVCEVREWQLQDYGRKLTWRVFVYTYKRWHQPRVQEVVSADAATLVPASVTYERNHVQTEGSYRVLDLETSDRGRGWIAIRAFHRDGRTWMAVVSSLEDAHKRPEVATFLHAFEVTGK